MDHPAFSLLPPLVAIVLAIATRKVLIPLGLGVAVGAFLLRPEDAAWYQPVIGFGEAMYQSVFDSDHLKALAFSLLLGSMVGVLEIGGAMEHLVARISKRIKTRRGAQTMIATSGLAIFFDDYANTLLVGGTMRSTADRYGISRSKLAYLVDSTAAPVAGLSIISTWAATEVTYMTDGLASAGITDPSAGFELFIRSIPYRFYPWLALLMVFLVARSGRDLRPMQSAEVEALEARTKALAESQSDTDSSSDETETSRAGKLAWVPTVLPVLICIATVLAVLVFTGYKSVGDRSAETSFWRYIGLVIGNGDSYVALIAGGAAGWLSTLIAHRTLWSCSAKTLALGSFRGAWQMIPAMLILWFAWALSAMTGKEALDTGGYLASMLSDSLDPRLLPTLVFVIAGAMAFSTGTSWGTMAILTPLSVTLSLQLTSGGTMGGADGAICLATSGSVLAGAIFGDHCSPISDTTVLSSRASGCDHVQHVRTQLPYALTVAVVCILLGCLPAAFGVSPWISLVISGVSLWAILRFLGKECEAPVVNEG